MHLKIQTVLLNAFILDLRNHHLGNTPTMSLSEFGSVKPPVQPARVHRSKRNSSRAASARYVCPPNFKRPFLASIEQLRYVMRQAQLLDAGIATKRTPAEHCRRKIKRLGHDQRKIELLAGQHHLVD